MISSIFTLERKGALDRDISVVTNISTEYLNSYLTSVEDISANYMNEDETKAVVTCYTDPLCAEIKQSNAQISSINSQLTVLNGKTSFISSSVDVLSTSISNDIDVINFKLSAENDKLKADIIYLSSIVSSLILSTSF